MSSSEAASSDSGDEDEPLMQPPVRGGQCGGQAARPTMQPEPEPEPEPELSGDRQQSPPSGRLAQRREGVSLPTSDDDADPLQEEARAKVKQAIVVNFPNPEHPKRCEMEMMLQFLQTMKDLSMFVKKYEADLGELAKIQMDMQLKTMTSWKRKARGLKAGIGLLMMMRGNTNEQQRSTSADELDAMRRQAAEAGVDVDNMTDEQLVAMVSEAEDEARMQEEEAREMKEADARWMMMQRQVNEAREAEEHKQAMLAKEKKERKNRERLRRLRRAHNKTTALVRICGVAQTDLERKLSEQEAEELRLKQKLASGLLSWEEEERIRQRSAEIMREKSSLKTAIDKERKARKDAAKLRLARNCSNETVDRFAASLVEFDVDEALSVDVVDIHHQIQPLRPAPGLIAEALVVQNSARQRSMTSSSGYINSLWCPNRASTPTVGGVKIVQQSTSSVGALLEMRRSPAPQHELSATGTFSADCAQLSASKVGVNGRPTSTPLAPQRSSAVVVDQNTLALDAAVTSVVLPKATQQLNLPTSGEADYDVVATAQASKPLEEYNAVATKQQKKLGVKLSPPTLSAQVVVLGPTLPKCDDGEASGGFWSNHASPQVLSRAPHLSRQRDIQQHGFAATVQRSFTARPSTAPTGEIFPARANSARARLQPARSSRQVETGARASLSPDVRARPFLDKVLQTSAQRSSMAGNVHNSNGQSQEHAARRTNHQLRHLQHKTWPEPPRTISSHIFPQPPHPPSSARARMHNLRNGSGGDGKSRTENRNVTGSQGARSSSFVSSGVRHEVHSGFACGTVLVSESSAKYLGLC